MGFLSWAAEFTQNTEHVPVWLLTSPTAVLDSVVPQSSVGESRTCRGWSLEDGPGMRTRTSQVKECQQRPRALPRAQAFLVSHSEVQTSWSDVPSANTVFLTTVCFLVSKCHRKGLSASSVIQWPGKILRCHFVSGQLVCA